MVESPFLKQRKSKQSCRILSSNGRTKKPSLFKASSSRLTKPTFTVPDHSNSRICGMLTPFRRTLSGLSLLSARPSQPRKLWLRRAVDRISGIQSCSPQSPCPPGFTRRATYFPGSTSCRFRRLAFKRQLQTDIAARQRCLFFNKRRVPPSNVV